MLPIRSAVPLLAPCLLLAACAAPPVVQHPAIGQPLFTRFTVRVDGPKIYSSNYSDPPPGYPPGTSATISVITPDRIDLVVNGVPYQLYAVEGTFQPGTLDTFIHKYFVTNPGELQLETMPPQTRSAIQSGTVIPGMTKLEAYLAMGPPPQVNFGQKTFLMPLEAILEQNRWEYYPNVFTGFFGVRRVILFASGEVVQVIQ